jgi:hypothetical protein
MQGVDGIGRQCRLAILFAENGMSLGDCGLDFAESGSVALGDNQLDRVLGSAAVCGLSLEQLNIGKTDLACNDFSRHNFLPPIIEM